VLNFHKNRLLRFSEKGAAIINEYRDNNPAYGNGRVGRILYNIHRLLLGLPIHVIHEGKEQKEYYTWF